MAARRAPHIQNGDGSSVDKAGEPPRAEGAGKPGRTSSRDEPKTARRSDAPAETRVAPSTSPDDALLAVVDTWPANVPIAIREVNVVEAFLGRFLDEILSEDPQG